MRDTTRILLRLYLNDDQPLGPGKIELLETIRDGGSISEAARAMRMSYRSAWLLVASMNALFRTPVVSTTLGGRGGERIDRLVGVRAVAGELDAVAALEKQRQLRAVRRRELGSARRGERSRGT